MNIFAPWPGGPVFFLLPLLALGIPGPCHYDAHDELNCDSDDDCDEGVACISGFCSGTGGTGAAPNVDCSVCPVGQVCDPRGECVPAERCIDADCPPGSSCVNDVCEPDEVNEVVCDFPSGAGCGADRDCVPAVDAPFGPQAVCASAADAELAPGDACVPSLTSNPCRSGAVCVISAPNRGVCLERCDDGGECAEPFVCSAVYAQGPPIEFCVPRCAQASDCPQGMNACLVPEDQPCALGNGVCGIAGCDNDRCAGACTPAGDGCPEGQVCSSTLIGDHCSDEPVQAPVCGDAPGRGDSCDLLGAPCSEGLSCTPSDTSGGGRCVDQADAADVVADNDACSAVDNANPCAAGSFCASPNPPELPAPPNSPGLCLALCDDANPCDDDTLRCAAGVAFAPAIEVCVVTCAFSAVGGDPPVCPGALVCDLNAGSGCNGDGSCVIGDGRGVPSDACTANVDCAAGDVCVGGTCGPIDSACP